MTPHAEIRTEETKTKDRLSMKLPPRRTVSGTGVDGSSIDGPAPTSSVRGPWLASDVGKIPTREAEGTCRHRSPTGNHHDRSRRRRPTSRSAPGDTKEARLWRG